MRWRFGTVVVGHPRVPDSSSPTPPVETLGDGHDLRRPGGAVRRGGRGIRNGSWNTGVQRCKSLNTCLDKVACLDQEVEQGDGRSVDGRDGEGKDYLLGTGRIHIERMVVVVLWFQSSKCQIGVVDTCEELEELQTCAFVQLRHHLPSWSGNLCSFLLLGCIPMSLEVIPVRYGSPSPSFLACGMGHTTGLNLWKPGGPEWIQGLLLKCRW